MLQLIPAANVAVFPNNYFATGTYVFDRDNIDFKVNYNPGPRGSIFARYSISPSDLFDPPSLGEAGGDALAGGQPGRAPGRIQSTAVGATYTLSNNVLFDANFGFTRQRLGAENIDIDTNYGLEVLGIPGTNGPDRLQGGYPRFVDHRVFVDWQSQRVQSVLVQRQPVRGRRQHELVEGARTGCASAANTPTTRSTTSSRRPRSGRAAASTSPAG